MASTTRFRICLIGNFCVVGPNGENIPIPKRRAKGILARLAVSDGLSTEKPELYNLLWSKPDTLGNSRRLLDNLRQCTRYIRNLFGKYSDQPVFVETERHKLSLNPDAFEVDFVEVLRAAEAKQIPDLIEDRDTAQIRLLGQLEIPNEQEFNDWLRDSATKLTIRLRRGFKDLLADHRDDIYIEVAENLAR